MWCILITLQISSAFRGKRRIEQSQCTDKGRRSPYLLADTPLDVAPIAPSLEKSSSIRSLSKRINAKRAISKRLMRPSVALLAWGDLLDLTLNYARLFALSVECGVASGSRERALKTPARMP